MGGKFNPFQSKQAEVVRIHTVANRKKALKVFGKLQRKRPCVWAEIKDTANPAAEQTLNQLDGETSVVLFINAIANEPVLTTPTPVLDALITRLWKHFNKLHIIQRVDLGDEGALEGEEE